MKEFSGRLRHRVEFLRRSDGRLASGRASPEWYSLGSSYAMVEAAGVGRMEEGTAASAMPRFRITLRNRADLQIDLRVKWKGRALEVVQLLVDPEEEERVTLLCEEVRP